MNAQIHVEIPRPRPRGIPVPAFPNLKLRRNHVSRHRTSESSGLEAARAGAQLLGAQLLERAACPGPAAGVDFLVRVAAPGPASEAELWNRLRPFSKTQTRAVLRLDRRPG